LYQPDDDEQKKIPYLTLWIPRFIPHAGNAEKTRQYRSRSPATKYASRIKRASPFSSTELGLDKIL